MPLDRCQRQSNRDLSFSVTACQDLKHAMQSFGDDRPAIAKASTVAWRPAQALYGLASTYVGLRNRGGGIRDSRRELRCRYPIACSSNADKRTAGNSRACCFDLRDLHNGFNAIHLKHDATDLAARW